jgi:2,3-dihydroxy-p-cumate/2,3-dihydroxybenzoate 3,4-dioxygenase
VIKLQDVSYVRLGTADLDGATKFATDYLGLEISHRSKDAVYLKSDQREHTLCYFHGSPADQTAAFEVAERAELDMAAAELDRLGHRVRFGRRRRRSCAGCEASSPSRIPPATTSSWCGGPP